MFEIEDLYMKYKQDIYIYLISLTHNHTLAEDLMSETFIKAIISLPGFRGESSVKTWLFGIARNTWLQQLRNQKKDVGFDELLGMYVSDDITEHIISKEIVKRIKELLSTKDDRTRNIIGMRVDGFSYCEISDKLELSESSARVIDFRTKLWLKSILEKEGLL